MDSGPITDAYSEEGVETHDPTEDEQKTSAYVHEQWQISESTKQSTIEHIWLSLAFYTGKQWSRYNRVSRLLTQDNPPPWRVRMVLNYILPTVETLAGKLVENRPGFICMPATSDDDDLDAARQCEGLLDYVWHELKIQNKIYEAMKWASITGTVFIKCFWDVEAGEEYEDEEEVISDVIEYAEGEIGLEGFKEREMKRIRRKSGLPVIDVLSPLEVAWDPGAKDMDTCRWMIHSNLLHIDEVRARWEKGKYVQPNTSYEVDEYSQQVMREFVSSSSNTDQASLDRINVLEYFERPSPRHPNGYYAIIAGNVVLEEEETLPYGRLPFVCIRHNSIPGKLAGEGVVRSLIPAQKELNKSVSQRIENKNLHAQPKWRAEKGSVEKQQFTDEPGELILYSRTATRPPEPLPPPPMSPEHRLIEKEQIEHIQNISGVSDITRGSAPAQTSGRAIGLLSDLDATKLGPTVRELESAIEGICEQVLWMWREYMPIEMTIQTLGRNKIVEVFNFHSKQIKNTHVRVMPNSMLPKHPSYRREQIIQMYQVGILGDPSDPRTQMKARKLMEFGFMENVYGDESKDRNLAREENELLEKGRMPDVNPFDDHAVHIDQHSEFMKSIDYRLLPEDVQENYLRHMAWHYYAESQNQQGAPWWQGYVDAGMKNMPPTAAPAGMESPEGGAPAGAAAGQPAGMLGGGTPELNQAIGTRGPGVADFEAGMQTPQ